MPAEPAPDTTPSTPPPALEPSAGAQREASPEDQQKLLAQQSRPIEGELVDATPLPAAVHGIASLSPELLGGAVGASLLTASVRMMDDRIRGDGQTISSLQNRNDALRDDLTNKATDVARLKAENTALREQLGLSQAVLAAGGALVGFSTYAWDHALAPLGWGLLITGGLLMFGAARWQKTLK